MDAPQDAARFGEYLLKDCLAVGPISRLWLAEQESVRRTVLIEELMAEHADQAEAFFANIRAKAAVDHPLIGTVYEAVAGPEACFYARELLPGATLADRLKAAEPLKPVRVAYALRRIAEANLYHETRGHATELFGPAAVHIDDSGVIRLENLAVAGTREADQSVKDVTHLGQTLPPLVADGLPGATRVLTLLSWMRGERTAAPLGWKAIHGYCEQIEQQLADLAPAVVPMTKAAVPPKKSWTLPILAGGLVLIGVIFLIAKAGKRPPRIAPRGVLPEAVVIPAGQYRTPDGTLDQVREFKISAHEVTIGQYLEFLEALDILTKAGRADSYDHDDQPMEKSGHVPDDWTALLTAAQTGGSWQQHPVTLDTPVVGVDWWDASAYADWKEARLPTQEEWFAALRESLTEPEKLAPGPWQAVTEATPDRTPNGLLGMAGGVAEWTRRPAVPPDNPLGQRQWVIIGGSFLKPANGALTRQWTVNRSLRRPDLGFRVVADH
jgi:formylglycine-generating enzyme required for sulfatase activity